MQLNNHLSLQKSNHSHWRGRVWNQKYSSSVHFLKLINHFYSPGALYSKNSERLFKLLEYLLAHEPRELTLKKTFILQLVPLNVDGEDLLSQGIPLISKGESLWAEFEESSLISSLQLSLRVYVFRRSTLLFYMIDGWIGGFWAQWSQSSGEYLVQMILNRVKVSLSIPHKTIKLPPTPISKTILGGAKNGAPMGKPCHSSGGLNFPNIWCRRCAPW